MYEMIWKLTSLPEIPDQATLEKQSLVNVKFPALTTSYFERINQEKEEKKALKKKSKGNVVLHDLR